MSSSAVHGAHAGLVFAVGVLGGVLLMSWAELLLVCATPTWYLAAVVFGTGYFVGLVLGLRHELRNCRHCDPSCDYNEI